MSEFAREIAGVDEDGLFAQRYAGNPASRAVLRTQRLTVLADLAPLTTGHLLVVPNSDTPSFATLDPETWDAWLAVKEQVKNIVGERWAPPTLFEHGSTVGMLGSACITHAHLHVVPGDIGLEERMAEKGVQLATISDHRQIPDLLGRDRPYFFTESPTKQAVVGAADTPRQPSQFLRRLAAAALGLPDGAWDWGVPADPALLRETVAAFTAERQ